MKALLYTYYTKHYRNEAFYSCTGMYNTYEEAKQNAERKFKQPAVVKVEVIGYDGSMALSLGKLEADAYYHKLG